MRRDALLPEEQLSAVVTALYADAEDCGWDTLSTTDRSRAYSRWVADARVGGILTKYMTPEAARSWIKDGPMKEYHRAVRGTGRYARFGRRGGTGPSEILATALGAGAKLVEGSVGIKPFHCCAMTPSGEVVYLVWGSASNFRNLLWAALCAAVDHGYSAHLVVMEPPGRTTTADDIRRHRAFASRCGLSVHYMRERMGDKPVGGGK